MCTNLQLSLFTGGKVVDPENAEKACLFQTAPQPQSYDFQHEHSEMVKRRGYIFVLHYIRIRFLVPEKTTPQYNKCSL